MTQMDSSKLEFEAAVLALSEYGFPKPLIKRTLKNILKVYAGDEAWPLIKENGYEVVVERLISDNKPQQRKSNRRVHNGLEKAKKQFKLDPDTGNAGVVSRSNKSSSSSLLVRPTLEKEDIDINSHQRDLWTRSGSLPSWFRVLDVSDIDVQQKFSNLHVLLERIDKGCFEQEQSVNVYSINSPKAVKDENFECIEEERQSKAREIMKMEEGDDRKGASDERVASTFTCKISNGLTLQTCDKGISFSQKQESNSTSLKTQIFADSVNINHSETFLPESSPVMPQAKRLGDVLHSQHDVSQGAFNTTGIKLFQREGFGSDGRKRKREKINKTQSTLYATERLDIARMSAFKLTRRRDGGPNPMFSRLQKLKEAGAGASIRTHQQENLDRNASKGSSPVEDLKAGTRPKESPELPPGFWEPSDRVLSADSPRLPPGFWEPCDASQDPTVPGQIHHQDSSPSDESPLLPPGFSEPYDSDTSQESPRLPPGFFFDALQDPTVSGRIHNQDSIPSDESPLLPPGFSEPYNSDTSQDSPRLPPGFCEPSERQISQEESWCFEGNVKGKGTAPKQVFIATIPEGFEDAEQKLYSLVRDVLQGFESVPISARLPCKIQVRNDHAFVEFCCEAMAGIFVDAYHANISALSIDGEQLLAARNMHLMKKDIQLRFAIASRLKGQVLDPRHVFYLGNVPLEWQNEERLFCHIANLLKEDASSTFIFETISVFTIPGFSDVYVHIPSSLLAETFFLKCLNDKDYLEEISTSLFICRNPAFLPRASRVFLRS